MLLTIEEIKKQVTPVAKKYGISRVYLFGSYARGEQNEKSDIDLKIDVRGTKIGLFELSGLSLDLRGKFGRKVDIVTEDSLFLNVRENVMKDQVLLYESKEPKS